MLHDMFTFNNNMAMCPNMYICKIYALRSLLIRLIKNNLKFIPPDTKKEGKFMLLSNSIKGSAIPNGRFFARDYMSVASKMKICKIVEVSLEQTLPLCQVSQK